jgi:hypothetical protein
VLHPKTDKFCNVLARFLFKCGDEIVQIEAAAAAGAKHVAERGVEDLWAVPILKAIEKQNAFRAKSIIGFQLMRARIRWDSAEQSMDNLRAHLRTFDCFAAARSGKCR